MRLSRQLDDSRTKLKMAYSVEQGSPRLPDLLMSCERTLRAELHVFSRGTRWFVFGRLSGVLLQLTEVQGAVLKAVVEDRGYDRQLAAQDVSYPQYKEIVLAATRLLAPLQFHRVLLRPSRSFLILVTDACNLACTYCYCRHSPASTCGAMTTRTADRIVEVGRELGIKHLAFFGGEPLLNVPVIKRVIDGSMRDRAEFSFSLTTNGTLLTDETARYLAASGVRVSVSIDGPQAVHDMCRVYRDGRGTFDDVSRGIALLKRWAILDVLEATHSARHPPQLATALSALSVNGVPVTCTCVEGSEDTPFAEEIVRGERIKNYYDQLLQGVIDHTHENRCDFGSGAAELVAGLLGQRAIHRPYICSGVMSRITIAPDGKMYPCPETIQADYCLGSVHDPGIASQLEGRRAAVLGLLAKGPALSKHWYVNLLDTCIVRLERGADGDLALRDPAEVEECVEYLIARLAEVTALPRLITSV